MRSLRWTFLICLAFACSAALWAQAPLAIKPGTKVRIQLKTRLDTKKSKVGEPVRAQIKQEIKQDHTVLLPKDGYLVGTITEIDASDHSSPGKIGVLFNEVTDKKGNVIGHLRAAIVHIAAGSTNYSQLTVPSEMGGSGMPVAQAGTGGALNSADQSSDGKPLAFAVMQTFNGSGTDLGGIIESAHSNFHLDQGTQVQAQILQSSN